ncbi:MAG: 4-hydroxythreonine-4-phosphate dehydrogenase PdxA [Ignavibacteriales bacterium]|nr:4-hydroxythreonine-4-phosphate dehydrogenase PdxA [Ignavibacteriales bacterium]
MKPLVAITIGDFNGVGPEIAMKTATTPAVRNICTPILVGPLNVLEHTLKSLKLRGKFAKTSLSVVSDSSTPVFDVGDGIWADVQWGKPTKASGKSAGTAIEQAVDLCLKKKVHAMVTAPASKEALNLAGYSFPGQTEMIALLSRSKHVAMMLVSETMRVGLVTTHVPLRAVSESISREKIVEKLMVVHDALQRNFRIKNPSIAVLALNPHAGDKGIIGTEDDDVVAPAVAEAKSRHINVEGPFPADAFFGNRSHEKFDVTLAMYHDQGLIPLKLSSFGKGVNFSAGLNIIRTSPDHGTAYDIAGKGKANISSMVEAVKLAVRFSR